MKLFIFVFFWYLWCIFHPTQYFLKISLKEFLKGFIFKWIKRYVIRFLIRWFKAIKVNWGLTKEIFLFERLFFPSFNPRLPDATLNWLLLYQRQTSKEDLLFILWKRESTSERDWTMLFKLLFFTEETSEPQRFSKEEHPSIQTDLLSDLGTLQMPLL